MVLLLLLVLGVFDVQSLDIYVNVKHGNDANSGLAHENALKSLTAAQKMIRMIKRRNNNKLSERITVNILPGTYFESLYFNTSDSGSIDSPITWQGIGSGVKISSGTQIDASAFSDCKSPLQKTNYPLKCANLKALNLTNVGKLQTTTGLMSCDNNKMDLFYNDKPQILSRYPNINYNTQMYVYTTVDSMKDSKTMIWKDTTNDNNVAMWSKETDPYLHGYWQFDWADFYIPVSSVSSAGNNMYDISSPSFTSSGYLAPNKGARFYTVNMLSELDSMSEYYIDRDSYILYWYPPTSNLQNNIFVSVNEYGLKLNDSASNLAFNNLTFEYSRLTGIYGRNLKNIKITNCKVYNSGNNGIDVEGYNINILNNDVQYTGCVGVHCVGGDYYKLTPGNNVVNNNHIYNFARWKRTYLPGLFFGGVGNDYSYNNITFGPHNGIDGGGNEAQGCNNNFTYNLLQNTTFETSDSGSFYTCGQQSQGWINRGNRFTHNTVKNIRNLVPLANGQDVTLNGIYLDDQMSGWDISFNTFINIDRGVFVGGGRSNMVYNNYCDKVDYCLHLDNRGMNWEATSCAYPNGSLWEGLYSVNYLKPPWSTEYPEMSTITKDNTCKPIFNQFENNEWCNGKGLADFSAQDAQAWGDVMKNNTNTCH